jgi:hypothetical protein
LVLANAGAVHQITTPAAAATTGTHYIRSEFATGCFYRKISTGDGKPIANINSGKPRCSMFSFNGRYYQQYRSNYKYGNNY